jgi:hypothetical protein
MCGNRSGRGMRITKGNRHPVAGFRGAGRGNAREVSRADQIEFRIASCFGGAHNGHVWEKMRRGSTQGKESHKQLVRKKGRQGPARGRYSGPSGITICLKPEKSLGKKIK